MLLINTLCCNTNIEKLKPVSFNITSLMKGMIVLNKLQKLLAEGSFKFFFEWIFFLTIEMKRLKKNLGLFRSHWSDCNCIRFASGCVPLSVRIKIGNQCLFLMQFCWHFVKTMEVLLLTLPLELYQKLFIFVMSNTAFSFHCKPQQVSQWLHGEQVKDLHYFFVMSMSSITN